MRGVLNSDLVLGVATYGRTTTRLRTARKPRTREEWIRVEAFAPVVEPGLVRRARALGGAKPGTWVSDRVLIARLRKLFVQHGRLSFCLIAKAKGVPQPRTYANRFGNLDTAYDLVGYTKDKRVRVRRPTLQTPNPVLLADLKACFDRHGHQRQPDRG